MRYPTLSLRHVLLFVSLLFLLLPVGGLYYLRIYENALIRQTESELISQAAFVAVLYAHEIQTTLESRKQADMDYGIPLPIHEKPGEKFELIPPQLDLRWNKIYPPRPIGRLTPFKPESIAWEVSAKIMPILKGVQKMTLSGIKILDPHGVVVTGPEEQGLSFADTEEFQIARTGVPVSMLRKRRMPETEAPLGSISRNATMNVFVALPIRWHDKLIGVVWVNRTPTDLIQALYGKRFELAVTAFWLVLIALLVTALISFTLTQPIRTLVQKTRLVAAGKDVGPSPVPVIREIAELSRSIDMMAHAVQYRSEYIRNFAAAVSHEFKTPLTAIQGSVELLQDYGRDMPPEKQQRFLGNIVQDTERLKRLVSRLMELACADMSEPFRQKTPLPEILKSVMRCIQTDDLRVSIQYSSLPSGDTPALFVRATPESLEAVLANLLENSRQAGADQVEMIVGMTSSFAVLDVQDNGPGISEGNRHEIFTPFFTTRRAAGGTGLGLSITQRLLERQGGSIQFVPSQGGARFRIEIPLA